MCWTVPGQGQTDKSRIMAGFTQCSVKQFTLRWWYQGISTTMKNQERWVHFRDVLRWISEQHFFRACLNLAA